MKFTLSLASFLVLVQTSLLATEGRDYRLPDEYELSGSSSLGLLGTGAAEASGLNAIQVNPALLVLDREYSFSASYHWPSQGRDFYRLGVVDGTTSQYAAAASFVGFNKKVEEMVGIEERDSRVMRRASLAIAYPFSNFALGGSLFYTEGLNYEYGAPKVEDGLSLGLGVVAFLTESIKIGLSAQNLNNKGVQNFAPQYYRGGLSWSALPDLLTINLDYRQRDRLAAVEGPITPVPGLELEPSDLAGYTKPEQMLYIGSMIRVYNLLKVSANYGESMDSDDPRRSISGSLGLYQQRYSLVYSLSKSHLDYNDLQSALTLQTFMEM